MKPLKLLVFGVLALAGAAAGWSDWRLYTTPVAERDHAAAVAAARQAVEAMLAAMRSDGRPL